MEEEQNTLQEEKKNFFTSKLFIIGSISIIILTLLIYLTVKKWIPAWIWWVVVILALIGIAIFLIFKFIIKKPEEEPVKEFSEKHVPKETDKKCSDYIKNKILMKYKKEIDDENPIEENVAPVGEEGKSAVLYWGFWKDYNNGATWGGACNVDNMGIWKVAKKQFEETFMEFKKRFEETLRSLAESFRPLQTEIIKESFDEYGRATKETIKKAPEIVIKNKPQEQPAFGEV